MNKSDNPETKDFSFILGGPTFQLFRRMHLSGNALELLKRRVIVFIMITWLPLFLLALVNKTAWGESLSLPFIKDIEVHIRFLVALPLLVIAELLVHTRVLTIVNQFRERNLIPESKTPQFNNAISSAFRLRNSVIAEVSILFLIYAIGYKLVWEQSGTVDSSTWHSAQSGGDSLSFAGIWFRFISLPIFQFLLLRWYYRIFIWSRFLFQVSRIKLKLVATHPDDAGGLGFLNHIVFAFAPLALVHGAITAGVISNQIFYDNNTLLDFKILIIILVVWVLCLVFLPLLFFSSQLAETKREGNLEYGKLAARYVQEFEARWIEGKAISNDPLLGSADIQSLADLANSYNVVEKMQFIPVKRNDFIVIMVITIIPVLPLVLTMMPISELMKMLAGILL